MEDRINIGKFSRERYSRHKHRNFFLDDYEIIEYEYRGKYTVEPGDMFGLMDLIHCWGSRGSLLGELFKFVKKDESNILKYILTDDILKIMFNCVVCELIDYWFVGYAYKERIKIDPDYVNFYGRKCKADINNVYYPEYLILLNEVIERKIKPFDFESVYIFEKLVCDLLEIPVPDRCLPYLPKSIGGYKEEPNARKKVDNRKQ